MLSTVIDEHESKHITRWHQPTRPLKTKKQEGGILAHTFSRFQKVEGQNFPNKNKLLFEPSQEMENYIQVTFTQWEKELKMSDHNKYSNHIFFIRSKAHCQNK